MDAKESAVAKSRGSQDEHDMSPPDALYSKCFTIRRKYQKMKQIM